MVLGMVVTSFVVFATVRLLYSQEVKLGLLFTIRPNLEIKLSLYTVIPHMLTLPILYLP